MAPDQCLECGFEFGEDRARLAARSGRFPQVLKDILESADADSVRSRPTPEIWSPIEYAAHLWDALRWYVARITRVLAEDLPQLEPFDFDIAADVGEYHRRTIDQVVTDLRAACQALADLARSLSDSQSSRRGLGSDGSPRTIAQLLTRAEHELVHHELDIRRALGLAPPP